ncbi:MAG: SDR family oxidoreductase [Actinomycetota bacterium]|nr:SDR family oxidoreductase [Actinomycetota bacterium]
MSLPPPAPGSTCLVTGASSGIGAEVARALGRRGQGVTLVARRAERLEELASELSAEHGVRAEIIAGDMSTTAGRGEVVAEIGRRRLQIEVLVNNAGFGSGGRFQELDREREVEMVALNVEAVVDLCGRLVPEMAARGRGAVLNVASSAAFQPLPRQATYGATKAFVLSFTDALTSDLAGTGVTATALCPGPVRTEFMESSGLSEEGKSVPSFLWTDADFVAEEGVKGLERGKRVVVPGRLTAAGTLAGQHAPRGLLLKALGWITPAGR